MLTRSTSRRYFRPIIIQGVSANTRCPEASSSSDSDEDMEHSKGHYLERCQSIISRITGRRPRDPDILIQDYHKFINEEKCSANVKDDLMYQIICTALIYRHDELVEKMLDQNLIPRKSYIVPISRPKILQTAVWNGKRSFVEKLLEIYSKLCKREVNTKSPSITLTYNQVTSEASWKTLDITRENALETAIRLNKPLIAGILLPYYTEGLDNVLFLWCKNGHFDSFVEFITFLHCKRDTVSEDSLMIRILKCVDFLLKVNLNPEKLSVTPKALSNLATLLKENQFILTKLPLIQEVMERLFITVSLTYEFADRSAKMNHEATHTQVQSVKHIFYYPSFSLDIIDELMKFTPPEMHLDLLCEALLKAVAVLGARRYNTPSLHGSLVLDERQQEIFGMDALKTYITMIKKLLCTFCMKSSKSDRSTKTLSVLWPYNRVASAVFGVLSNFAPTDEIATYRFLPSKFTAPSSSSLSGPTSCAYLYKGMMLELFKDVLFLNPVIPMDHMQTFLGPCSINRKFEDSFQSIMPFVEILLRMLPYRKWTQAIDALRERTNETLTKDQKLCLSRLYGNRSEPWSLKFFSRSAVLECLRDDTVASRETIKSLGLAPDYKDILLYEMD